MKRSLIATSLVSAALAISAVPAFASDAYPDGGMLDWVPQSSVLTRAQVTAEIAQARAQGLIEQPDSVYPKIASVGPAKTRAQVEQELAADPAGSIYQNP